MIHLIKGGFDVFSEQDGKGSLGDLKLDSTILVGSDLLFDHFNPKSEPFDISCIK